MRIAISRLRDDIHGRPEISIHADLSGKTPTMRTETEDSKWEKGIAWPKVKEWTELASDISIKFTPNVPQTIIDGSYWEMRLGRPNTYIVIGWYHSVPADWTEVSLLYDDIIKYSDFDRALKKTQ